MRMVYLTIGKTSSSLNPNQNNSDEDLDNDGLSNIVEFQNSTDPTKKDTDSDGVFDGW